MRVVTRTVILLVCAALIGISAATGEEKPVWQWFASCGGPKMVLEVRLDAKVIYTSSFPICHAVEPPRDKGFESKRLEFKFASPRALVWRGYRSDRETTRAGLELDGNVWQAGADCDDLLLGVSFMDAEAIYMNTVHIARPFHRDTTQIADGLFVITFPADKGNQTSER
jgi:hypothetical protein